MTSTKTASIETIAGGHVTTPKGFVAGAVCAGITPAARRPARPRQLLFSERECTAAGVFTQNLVARRRST